jgi:Ca2+-dependent lipid-binding protein
MWLDIEEMNKKVDSDSKKEWELSTEPIRNYEFRVAIFDTRNIPTLDIEGTSDVYIQAYIV